MDLKGWLEPASLEVQYSDDEKDRILGFIIAKGSSFPSEISKHLLIDLARVNAMLIQMLNDKKLARIVPDELYPQPLIKCRIAEMWANGIYGFKEFIARSWFIASEEGFWHYANKFKGQHRRANVAYFQSYHIELAEGYDDFDIR